MAEGRDPVRLMDARGVDPALRAALQRVSQSEPDPAQLAALVERVGEAVTNAGGGSWFTQLVSQSTGVKLMALVVTGGAAFWAARSTPPSRQEPQTPVVTASAGQPGVAQPGAARADTKASARDGEPNTAVPPAAPAPTPVISTLPARLVPTSERVPARDVHRAATRQGALRAVLPDSQPQRGLAAQRAPSAVPKHGAAAQADAASAPVAELAQEAASSAETELALITSAQRALGKAPRRAVELLDRHDTLYPEGSFAEEREVLWIDALSQLGMARALEARARRFLARYPQSIHCARVRALLHGLNAQR
jgi:hypothetical protein